MLYIKRVYMKLGLCLNITFKYSNTWTYSVCQGQGESLLPNNALYRHLVISLNVIFIMLYIKHMYMKLGLCLNITFKYSNTWIYSVCQGQGESLLPNNAVYRHVVLSLYIIISMYMKLGLCLNITFKY